LKVQAIRWFIKQELWGAGLGYISKSYIDLLGGKIWAENNRDKGAVFVLKSHLLNSMKLKRNPLLQAKVPWTTKIKILVAEDDSISLKFISKILKIFGDNLLIAEWIWSGKSMQK
jgi:hypothetical protein